MSQQHNRNEDFWQVKFEYDSEMEEDQMYDNRENTTQKMFQNEDHHQL